MVRLLKSCAVSLAAALVGALACIPISSGAEGDACDAERPCRMGLACDQEVCVPYVRGTDAGPGIEPYLLPALDSFCRDDVLPPWIATGADLLAVTRSEYLTTLTSIPSTPLNIGVSYEGGRILCNPAQLAPPDSGMPDQAAFVTLEAVVHFVTDDGAFAEHFTTPLSGVYKTANFVIALSLAELSGSFDPQMPNHEGLGVTIGGTFAAEDTYGEARKNGQQPGQAPESISVGSWDNRE